MTASQRQAAALAVATLAVLLVTACGAAAERSDAATGALETVGGNATPEPSTSVAAVDPVVVASETSTPTTVPSTSEIVPGPTDPVTSSAVPTSPDDPGADAAALSGVRDSEPVAEARAALADGDLCGVYLGLAHVDLETTSTVRLLDQLRTVHAVMAESVSIAPTDLRRDWVAVTDGMETVVEALSAEGNSKAAASKASSDPEFREAQVRVDQWMGANCG